MSAQFRKTPRPDAEVVELLQRLLSAAQHGYVRSVVVVTVNPVQEVERLTAGDLSPIRLNALLGGLAQLKSHIISLLS